MQKKQHHITTVGNGFQVRVVRNKKEHSRYFSFSAWGTEAKAMTAAINWREQVEALVGRSKPRSSRPVGQKSTGIIGVTRRINYDKRCNHKALVYSCHWRLNGNAHNKTFYVGPVDKISADDEFHAFRTAVLFRKEYDFYRELGLEALFNPDKYQGWRNKRFYGGTQQNTLMKPE